MSVGPREMGSSRDGTLSWLQRREIGQSTKPGQTLSLTKNLYSSVQVVSFYSPFSNHSDGQHHGGIFNFDFSTDGRVLVAACEKRSFLVFDPFTGKLLQTKNGAHLNCVNCVKFLDTRTFATCSDDNTVALWDLRFLNSKIRSLHGHSYWVKNIEYAASCGLLVTSGFDGAIYTWDINNYSNEDGCRRVFYTDGLMRSKLTPDDSKLVVATAEGYLVVVHCLDLLHLDTDTADFQLHFTQMLQDAGTAIIDTGIKHMFDRARNRVELLCDFPRGNKAMVITSLQVHPQGWCVSSRNTSSDESSEWTCVHDITDSPLAAHLRTNTRRSLRHVASPSDAGPHDRNKAARFQSERTDSSPLGSAEGDARTVQGRPQRLPQANTPEPSIGAGGDGRRAGRDGERAEGGAGQRRDDDDEDEDELGSLGGEQEGDSGGQSAPATRPRRRRPRWRVFRLRVAPEDVGSLLEASPSSHSSSVAAEPDGSASARTHSYGGRSGDRGGRASREDAASSRRVTWASGGEQAAVNDTDIFILRLLQQAAIVVERNTPPPRRRYAQSDRLPHGLAAVAPPPPRPRGYSVHVPGRRLQFFAQEPNVGRGYIKEQCFSADGRLVVSPHGNGLRLLAFDASCSELCDCPPLPAGQARELHELTRLSMHSQVALTTRFSPTQCMFVSGALDGSVAFIQPCL